MERVMFFCGGFVVFALGLGMYGAVMDVTDWIEANGVSLPYTLAVPALVISIAAATVTTALGIAMAAYALRKSDGAEQKA